MTLNSGKIKRSLIQNWYEYVLATYPRRVEGYADSINFARQFSWEERTHKILSYLDESSHPPIEA